MSKEIKNIENSQTLGDFLNFAKSQLFKFTNPQLEAEMLLSFCLKRDRAWLKTHPEYILTKDETQKSREIIEQRKNNIPLAYIRGWKMWNNLKIKVSPDVLIPRDETEILANYIWESAQENKSRPAQVRKDISPDLNFSRDFPKTILDIGTGSGCLAIFCAKKFPKAEVTAIDICSKALKIAQENAQTHQVKIDFIKSDLLDKIPAKKYDIIIANLPYVPTNIEITADVRKEPSRAIFAGKDGLDLIRKLAEQLKSREISFHELWLEFWTAQEDEIKNIFAEFSVEFYPDLSGDTYFAKITPKR